MQPVEVSNVKTVMKDKCHLISPLQKKMINGIMKELAAQGDSYTLNIESAATATTLAFTGKDQSVSSFTFPVKKECQLTED